MSAVRQDATELDSLVDAALREDLGSEEADPAADITTAWTVPPGTRALGVILTRADGVLAGLEAARRVFLRVDATVEFGAVAADGVRVTSGDYLARIRGDAASLLCAERTALNFLQQLSGVATLTRTYVDAVAGTGARITDTRKTTPGFRQLEKQAVALGGGVNHRYGLYDAVLIKENHAACAGGVVTAVRHARRAATAAGRTVPIYAEAETLEDVRGLLSVAPDRVMLDNMRLDDMRTAVALIRDGLPDTRIEATGGVSLGSVREVAETGVDLISVGALTHSAAALDLTMLFEMDGE